MAYLADRVREDSTTEGTGAFTLSGASPLGYQTFTQAGADGMTVDYTIEAVDDNYIPTGQWEVGRGVYDAGTDGLTRDTVLAGSDGPGVNVDFAAGNKNVFITIAAETLDDFLINSAGANTALSNLASVAINTTLATGAGTAAALTATAPAQITTAQAGAAASLTASDAVAGSSVAGAAAGANASVIAGNAARLTSGNANGGNVVLRGGTAVGTGTEGQTQIVRAGTAARPTLYLLTDSTTGWYRSAGDIWTFSQAGTARITLGNGITLGSAGVIAFTSGASTAGADVGFCRAASNSLQFAGGSGVTAGQATSRTEINKLVSSIVDATATKVFTITIPNAAHSANVEVTINGSLGAGGAIGANEATGTVKYNVSIARTAGVNAVATISTAYGSANSSVAGAATITVTGDLSAISGAVGAVNTFTIRVTITKGSGSSANHTCTAHAVLLNANASGITIA